MRAIFQFFKTTLVGGFFVVLPVALVLLLLGETIQALLVVTEPATGQLPVETIMGIDVALLASILVVALLCFATGLLMRTDYGTRFGAWLERVALKRLPGYTLLRTLTRRLAGTEESARFAPALADLHGSEARALVFIVEEHESGDCTVFLPVSPTPTVGFIYTLRKERVRTLDAPISSVINCIMHWGIGSKNLVDSR
jgi:uncharacterized membrane protein